MYGREVVEIRVSPLITGLTSDCPYQTVRSSPTGAGEQVRPAISTWEMYRECSTGHATI
jgi:hypothetical protein